DLSLVAGGARRRVDMPVGSCSRLTLRRNQLRGAQRQAVNGSDLNAVDTPAGREAGLHLIRCHGRQPALDAAAGEESQGQNGGGDSIQASDPKPPSPRSAVLRSRLSAHRLLQEVESGGYLRVVAGPNDHWFDRVLGLRVTDATAGCGVGAR